MSFSLQHPHWRSLARLFAIVLCLMMLSLGVSATGEAQPPNQQPEESMNQNPTFTITMKSGQVLTGELYPQIAPESVGNFIALANASFYDGLIFHRVIPGFMIQGGCPDGTGMGGPGYAIKGEFSGNGVTNSLKHTRGVLSMARAMDPNSAGSQFFIMHMDAPHLDKQYAAFGKVTEGMDVVDAIARTPRSMFNDKPTHEQKMKTVTVETFGEEYAEPETC